jgi:glycosyltransferase involved in cell wall biosynthesis
MDKKIRILVIPSDRVGGVGFFRSTQPHLYIADKYADEFEVDIMYELPKGKTLEDVFKNYDILHFHKQLDKDANIIKTAKFLGLKVIMDIDDHFKLGDFHPMSISAKKEKWHEPIIKHLELADMVTTTTPIFAKVLRKYNKNVVVLPNAIDPNDPRFQLPNNPPQTKRIRFGVICGSSHYHDMIILKDMVKALPQNIIDKIQFVLCGFDTNGTRTIYHEDTGQVERRPILPQESVWYDYEKIMTNNYQIVPKDEQKFLEMFIKNVEYPNLDTAYRRCWTKDINHYYQHYDNIDVLLVPLKECEFNAVKSQLKVIEAGFGHKAIIAQNYGAYTIDLHSMVEKGGKINENGNALLVETDKNHKQWAKYIKMLVEKPEMIKKLQDNLYETVKDEYSLDTVCKKRVEAYKKLVG